MPVIYKLTCKTTNQSYIGQTIRTAEVRWEEHKRESLLDEKLTLFHSMVKLYGADDFVLSTLIECTKEELNDHETRLIKEHNTLRPNGYNTSKGGSYGALSQTSDVVKEPKPKPPPKPKPIVDTTKTDHVLPTGLVELHYESGNRKEHGFRVIISRTESYTFISIQLSMEEKYKQALECYEKLKNGEEYVFTNKFKHSKFDVDIPKYIVRRGDKGVAVHKPGYTRKTFAHVHNTFEQNLQNAINYLKTLQ